jgi:hypothetical protein
MRSRGLWIAVGLLLTGTSAVATASPAQARTKFGIWLHGAWSWFGDPRAVHVTAPVEATFVGWINWAGDVMIGAYYPGLGVMRTHQVGVEFHDDHGAPSLLIEPDKRLTVFWSSHNGADLHYRTTKKPEDIRHWAPQRNVPHRQAGGHGYTYPNPLMLSAEHDRLYLFFRGPDYSADYMTRSSRGHWGAAHRLIVVPGQRPYVKVDSRGRNRIAIAFTNGHPRETTTSIYYMAYEHDGLWTAAGRRIGSLPGSSISPSQADLVYDGNAHGVAGWVWDVAFNHRGRPVIVYATFPSADNHEYWYADRIGHRWVSHFMTFAGPTISPGTIEYEYSGGITLDHSDPSIVYLSKRVNGHWEIERWTTSDGGYRWRHTTIAGRGSADNIRPVVPRGSTGGPMSLVWLRGRYNTYTTYRTSIAYLR